MSAPLSIERSPLRSAIRRRLIDRLLHGEPGPGASLNEAVLAGELGVSRTPLREALLGLEREGLVHVEPGRGFFVMPLTLREAAELYPMLWTLEGLAVRIAPPASRVELARLATLNRELNAARFEPDAALALDGAWHRALVGRCGNGRLLEAIESLRNQAFRYEFAFMRNAGRLITSVAQHAVILAALRANRPERAAREVGRHWRRSLEFLEPWLAGRDPEPRVSTRTRPAAGESATARGKIRAPRSAAAKTPRPARRARRTPR